jgi:hypothetical protein
LKYGEAADTIFTLKYDYFPLPVSALSFSLLALPRNVKCGAV